MYKVPKVKKIGDFWPLIKHCPHCMNFIIPTFINEKIKYSKYLYKIWKEFISFDMKEQKGI